MPVNCRNGIEQNGNRRGIRNGAVMANIRFAAIDRFVVVRRLYQSEMIAKLGSAFCTDDGLCGGFRSSAGDQKFLR